MQTVMPPASRIVPLSTCWLSPMTVTVSLMSPNTRWLSCTSDIAGRRDANAPPDPQEDALVQLVLEQQNLAADRRLRHVQLSPGAGERSGLGDRLDDLELAQIHRRR